MPTYPDKGYNHSGWITPDGNYYVMADETWGMRMKMLDISDFSNIQVIALFGSGVDVNLYLTIKLLMAIIYILLTIMIIVCTRDFKSISAYTYGLL